MTATTKSSAAVTAGRDPAKLVMRRFMLFDQAFPVGVRADPGHHGRDP
jgi:hypothetical protein